LTAGLLRASEIAAGMINHALIFTTPFTANRFVPPALHTDGRSTSPDAMPMGGHIFLEPGSVPTGLPGWKKTIARCLSTYGAFCVDSGGSLSIRAESSLGRGKDVWSEVGMTIGPSLSWLPWQKFKLVGV
jgi:hypothetical protein